MKGTLVDNKMLNYMITTPPKAIVNRKMTDLRASASYIRGYVMWTEIIGLEIIPVTMLLFLNIRIILKIFGTSGNTKR